MGFLDLLFDDDDEEEPSAELGPNSKMVLEYIDNVFDQLGVSEIPVLNNLGEAIKTLAPVVLDEDFDDTQWPAILQQVQTVLNEKLGDLLTLLTVGTATDAPNE